MAGDDLLDAYIASALKSTGTAKAPKEAKPAAGIRQPEPARAPRSVAGTNPPPTARPRTTSAPPHSVVARTVSQTRTPTPPNATPTVARTPTPSSIRPRTPSAPPAAARPRTPSVPGTYDNSPMASIDRARPPTPPPPPFAHTPVPAHLDFSEDTVPEMQASSALTDQDDRGVRRS